EGTTVGQAGHQLLTVYVWRQDGFNGSIALTAEGLPPGVTCKPQLVPSGAKQVPFVLSAGADAAPWAGEIKILGKAKIDGKEVVREARAATISWPVPQVNLPTITRMDRAVVLAVRDKAPFSLTADVESLTLKQGERIQIPLKLTR